MKRLRANSGGSQSNQKIDLRDSILIGIGNDGRNDDGLGWAFLDALQRDEIFPGHIHYRYQLQIEDAELISHHGHVIFVDACRNSLPGGFRWRRCTPKAEFEFTSHSLAPETVLFLCQTLYHTTPTADLMLIQGTSWNLEIGLSENAATNLDEALRFFTTSFSQ